MPTKLQPWKESVCLLHFQWQIVSYCATPWSVLEFTKDYAELSMFIKIVDIKIKNTAKTVPHFLSNITANVRMRSVFKDCSPRLSSPSRCLLVGSFLSSDTSSTIVSLFRGRRDLFSNTYISHFMTTPADSGFSVWYSCRINTA